MICKTNFIISHSSVNKPNMYTLYIYLLLGMSPLRHNMLTRPNLQPR